MENGDQKILILLDTVIARDIATEGVFTQLERLSLYIENMELIRRIDTTNVLVEDIRDDIKFRFTETMQDIAGETYGPAFEKLYDQLSASGKNQYWWRNSPPPDMDFSDFLPW